MEWALIERVGSVIGPIAGIGALVVSIISIRRANSVKSLDLRLEAQRIRNDALSSLTTLDNLFEQAIKSREAVAAAAGHRKSGAMQKWQAEWDEDRTVLKRLRTELDNDNKSYDILEQKELEKEIVELDRIRSAINSLLDKYKKHIEEDDRQREQIHQAHQAYRSRGNS